MSGPTEAEFMAARAAALSCATTMGELLGCASGVHHLPTRLSATIEHLLADARWEPPDFSFDRSDAMDRILICRGVKGLCKALDRARGQITPVEEYLRRVSACVHQGGGMKHDTAHRLALDLAHQLWLGIRNIDPEFTLRDQGGEGLGFELYEDLVELRWEEIRDKLRARPRFDTQEIKASIQLESARAIERFAARGGDERSSGRITPRETAKAPAGDRVSTPQPRGRGRPKDTDEAEDRRIYLDWKSKGSTKHQYAQANGISLKQLRRAIERYLKRARNK